MSQVNAPKPLAPLAKLWVNAPLKFNNIRSVVQAPLAPLTMLVPDRSALAQLAAS